MITERIYYYIWYEDSIGNKYYTNQFMDNNYFMV